MAFLVIFVSGFLSGIFFEVKHDEYKNYKISQLEHALDVIEDPDDYTIYKDSADRIWVMRDGTCALMY